LNPASAIAGSPSRNEKRAASSRFEAEREGRRQGRTGTRHAGDQRTDLGDAHHHRVGQRYILDLAHVTRAQLGDREQHRHHDTGPADHVETA